MIELKAHMRTAFGRAVTPLRRSGFIPAELYGHGVENVHLSVPVKDFTRVFKAAGESSLVDLAYDTKRTPVLIHDLARDPKTGDVLAIDFYQVRLDEKIKVKVPLQFEGEAPAVKNLAGVLVKAVQELEVEALPSAMPAHLTVDLSKLTEIGATIHVREIPVPAGAKVLTDPQTVVAAVTEPRKEEEVVAPVASVEDVKVEGEEKKAERQAKKEAETGGDKGGGKGAAPAPKA